LKLKKILLVSPTKNDALYLPRYLRAWEKVEYPRDQIRWIFQYGRSIDKTKEILDKYFKKHKWNVEIRPEIPFQNKTNSALWIADVLNEFRALYNNEDYVIIPDTDIIKFPKNILNKLLELDLDIVAPYVWIEKTNPPQFFDTYLFRDLCGKKFSVLDVPILDKPIELSSAGSFLVIKGNIFKEIKFENPIPHLQFCRNARNKGYRIWGIPWIKVYHANVLQKKEIHYSLEWYIRKGILPHKILDKI